MKAEAKLYLIKDKMGKELKLRLWNQIVCVQIPASPYTS